MFHTQWEPAICRHEKSTEHTLVSLVPCMSNQERIAQSLLTGALVQASNVGYDFQADEEVKDIMFDVQKRNLDIVDRLNGVSLVRYKVDQYIQGKLADEKKKADELATKGDTPPPEVVPSESERKA